ncbi:two component transcriptional regulator, LytTR family [Spongiibacter sp. IMCC21906]|uniref:LytR/AlgR family response regulator transcription factor n=1 Tax=Spongiibacter sp. IMCC21906 TaxID=1620392 RepID=UPI00062DE696|nr:LytTR family DNA-binding domain-containing protein [Spongiibacter sp. IMCC21906]AKH67957.1 two component transcriptional regulator, LytTR family [Spongiibacter sp. IMCC21906]
MRVMIVDDEPLARLRMQRLLEPLPHIELVAEAENAQQALERYASTKPELLLLDIEMPGKNGIELAQLLAAESPAPAIVFCTAYDAHAIAAFEAKAIAYLLKPVKAQRLTEVLAAATQLNRAQLASLTPATTEPADSERINELELAATQKLELSARQGGGIQRLALDAVHFFYADNKYVTAVYGGGELLLDESLKELEQLFGERLQRVHRNALVVWARVQGMQRITQGRYRVMIEGVTEGPIISRRHLAAFKARLP